MRPDSMHFERGQDKQGRERLEVRYYDHDGEFLREFFYLGGAADSRAFYYNFARMHLRVPERQVAVASVGEALRLRPLFRMPLFVIARKKTHFWQIREKIFE